MSLAVTGREVGLAALLITLLIFISLCFFDLDETDVTCLCREKNYWNLTHAQTKERHWYRSIRWERSGQLSNMLWQSLLYLSEL